MRDQRTNSGALGQPASKRCAACRATKPLDQFYADRHGRHTSRCKDCHRQQTRANNRRRHAALRLLIAAHPDEYRALLCGTRIRRDDQTESASAGGSDAA